MTATALAVPSKRSRSLAGMSRAAASTPKNVRAAAASTTTQYTVWLKPAREK